MPSEFLFYLIGIPTVFLIAVGKGAFGGGLATLGVPLLSLVLLPIEAAIVVAPLVSLMDVFALGSFGPRTWSKPDLLWLLPSLVLGIALGYFFFTHVDPNLVAAAIGAVTLAFTADWFLRGRKKPPQKLPVSPPLALAAGVASGFTTFIAHAEGRRSPCIFCAAGCIRRCSPEPHRSRSLRSAISSSCFPTACSPPRGPSTIWAALALAPAVPVGVWVGKYLHDRLEQNRLFFWCYLILAFAAAKLLFNSIRAFAG